MPPVYFAGLWECDASPRRFLTGVLEDVESGARTHRTPKALRAK